MVMEIRGILYYFSNHALKRMQERNIPEEWVRETISNPDYEPDYDENRDNYRYDRIFRHNNLVHRLRVIVDENFKAIVTVEYRD